MTTKSFRRRQREYGTTYHRTWNYRRDGRLREFPRQATRIDIDVVSTDESGETNENVNSKPG